MTVALLLIGFIRDVNFIINITTFYNNNINNKFDNLHIYYSCPSKLEEFDEFEFNLSDPGRGVLNNQYKTLFYLLHNMLIKTYNKLCFLFR
jgi:hypothetical protein